MAVPSDKDLKLKKEKIDLIESKLINGKMKEKDILSMIRSNVRLSWMRCPVKLLKLNKSVIPDHDINTRTKWLYKCEYCNDSFKQKDVEVDHTNGVSELKTLSDVELFITSVIHVSLEDLQILCKHCHSIKTYSERLNISYEEAIIEKQIISWIKNTSVSEQKKYIKSFNLPMNNAKERKISYKFIITK
jgi:5-methylcytosine-specific restriction endonuclease McrA